MEFRYLCSLMLKTSNNWRCRIVWRRTNRFRGHPRLSYLCLETLVLSGYCNADIHRWAMRWVTRLTTLELRITTLDLDWMAFPELLVACSNSLTRLHLDIIGYSTYEEEFHICGDNQKSMDSLKLYGVANTAPAILDQDVVLRFYYFNVSDFVTICSPILLENDLATISVSLVKTKFWEHSRCSDGKRSAYGFGEARPGYP